MADTTHVPDLDDFDRTTVRLYRGAIAVGAMSLLFAGAAHMAAGTASPEVAVMARGWAPILWALFVYATGAVVIHLHLYARRIRWVVHGLAWTGVVLIVSAGAVPGESLSFWLQRAGLGFLFATWSAVALKEQFCFKLPWMRLVPWFFGASLAPLCAGAWLPAGLLLFATGGLLTLLASAKQGQPFHYDIGDKSQYEV